MFEEKTKSDQKKDNRSKMRANELDGKTWTKYSISIWSDIRKSHEEASLKHPAMFPIELPRRLIEIFTNNSQTMILDPFAGVGSTAIAAQRQGKESVNLEISAEYCDIIRQRLHQQELFQSEDTNISVINDDARKLRDYVQPRSVDLTITSPPYWDILLQKRTADYKAQRDYGEGESDLGKIRDYQKFLTELKRIFAQVYEVSKPGAYCCVIVMDLRKKDKFYSYHSDIAHFMVDVGFKYDDIIIWDRRHEYNNMRPLGYPYVFRVNKAHEYILIFQKPRG